MLQYFTNVSFTQICNGKEVICVLCGHMGKYFRSSISPFQRGEKTTAFRRRLGLTAVAAKSVPATSAPNVAPRPPSARESWAGAAGRAATPGRAAACADPAPLSLGHLWPGEPWGLASGQPCVRSLQACRGRALSACPGPHNWKLPRWVRNTRCRSEQHPRREWRAGNGTGGARRASAQARAQGPRWDRA